MTTRPTASSALAILFAVGGCAGGMRGPEVKPEEIPALEAEVERRPSDAELMTRLGIGYYNDRNFPRAADLFRSALALDAGNYRALVYLGLAFEEQGELDSARARLNAAGALARDDRRRRELAAHLQLLTRRELQSAARLAIAREGDLTTAPPEGNTLAVFPFRYLGSDETLRPLERGISQLLVTDLGKVSALRLLEREQVQVLVDELRLGSEGRTDPSTGARSGRMLRAGQVVQGTLQEPAGAGTIQLDATVVNTTSAQVTASGAASDRLQRLFDMEKTVVFQLLERLGIALSPAEQRALSERPTADLQAFLAFSRGLEAEDRGDFRGAAAAFGEAVRLDPAFSQAGQKQGQMTQLSVAAQTPAPELAGDGAGGGGAGGGTGDALQQSLDAVAPSVGGTLDDQTGSTPPEVRAGVSEALGLDDLRTGLLGSIIIIVTRP